MKYLKWLFLVLFAFAMGGQHTYAAQTFTDVSTKHSNYAEIEWAVSQGLLKGYSDKTFKPNNFLTEAQFAKIFTRYTSPETLQDIDSKEETTIVYDYFTTIGIPLTGHTNATAKNKSFTRIQVAHVFYHNYVGKAAASNVDVIDWMYANGLTNGKGISSNKYTDFGSNDSLKRAHISAFFSRYDKLVQGEEAVIDEDQVVADALQKELTATTELIQFDRINLTAAADDEYFAYIRDRAASLVDRATNTYIIFSYDAQKNKTTIFKKWSELSEYSFLQREQLNNQEQMIIWANTGSDLKLELTVVAANNANSIVVTPITKSYPFGSFYVEGNTLIIEQDKYRLTNGKLVKN